MWALQWLNISILVDIFMLMAAGTSRELPSRKLHPYLGERMTKSIMNALGVEVIIYNTIEYSTCSVNYSVVSYLIPSIRRDLLTLRRYRYRYHIKSSRRSFYGTDKVRYGTYDDMNTNQIK